MSTPLIQGYSLKLTTPECHPDVHWFRVNIDIFDDLTEVLPYLNSELEDCDYNHDAQVLLWINKKQRYAFRPHEIVVAPVESKDEAEELTKQIIDMMNDIWARRDEITPDFKGRKSPPNTLDIYKLLPRSNCKECGFPTCMAFAAALRVDSEKLLLCPYLSEKDYISLVS